MFEVDNTNTKPGLNKFISCPIGHAKKGPQNEMRFRSQITGYIALDFYYVNRKCGFPLRSTAIRSFPTRLFIAGYCLNV